MMDIVMNGGMHQSGIYLWFTANLRREVWPVETCELVLLSAPTTLL